MVLFKSCLEHSAGCFEKSVGPGARTSDLIFAPLLPGRCVEFVFNSAPHPDGSVGWQHFLRSHLASVYRNRLLP